jgi:hypothetical protein
MCNHAAHAERVEAIDFLARADALHDDEFIGRQKLDAEKRGSGRDEFTP